MISKKNFIKYINKLKEVNDIYNEINKVAKKLKMFEIYDCEYENIILNILQEVFKDRENDWIGHFIYELNYGEDWGEDCISDNGDVVYMRDAGELYDVLVANLSES